jgi:UDP-3-O-[3-hydroxymyristoyl] N-acetylglucosamine deacetylase
VTVFLRKQRTLTRPVQVNGFGFWSGRDVCVEFRPAPPDAGLTFVRVDLDPVVRIPAHVQHRIEVPRRTTLASGGVRVEMVEHILAACAGLQLDNCEIWVNEPEMPGFDGSSWPFVEALLSAGLTDQAAVRRQLVVTHTLRVGDHSSWIAAHPRSGGLFIDYQLDYGPGPIGRQSLDLEVTCDHFVQQLARARTFLTVAEAEWLRHNGLGSRVTYRDLLVIGEQGPVENQLHYSDECVRHKTLDVLGDLALIGCDIVGRIVAYRSGHRLNADLGALLLAAQAQREEMRLSA